MKEDDSTPGVTDLMTITEAAQYSHVSRQAIYVALRDKRLKGVFHKRRWYITREDLDYYRSQKYIGDNRKRNGQKIFDLEKGIYSVLQLSKFMSEALGRPYTPNRLYFLLKRGRLKSMRVGSAWVIHKEDAIKLLEQEQDRRLKRKAE